MPKPRTRLPHEVAARLDISTSTLRRWSKEFAPFLSETAGTPQPSEQGEPAHRRYTDEDLETLLAIKGLLAEGFTYAQAASRLQALRVGETPQGDVYALTPGDEPVLNPAVSILADTIHTVADGQQMLMNSQQASRDMLGVIIQDNFNLKEENVKLRDRMLQLERDLAGVQRREEERRLELEERVQRLESRVRRALMMAERRPAEREREEPGCLGRMLGM